MARTPDRFPGTRYEDEVVLNGESSDPVAEGAMRYVGGDFRLCDNIGVFNPRTGGATFDVNTIMVDDITNAVMVDDITKNVLVDE